MKYVFQLWFVFFIFTLQLNGQGSFQTGLLPSINLSTDLARDWQINLKLESRQALQEGRFGDDNPWEYKYLHTDASLIAAKKISANHRLGFGFLTRFTQNGLVFRTIQQLSFSRSLEGWRLGGRLSTDQTFKDQKASTYRLRFRFTAELPLSGQAVDRNEIYLKVNHEYLNEWDAGIYDLEIRLIPLLGYLISDASKVEAGIDYRLSSFLRKTTENRFWLAINWYVKL